MALHQASKDSSDGITLVIKALGKMHFVSRVPSSIKLENNCTSKAIKNNDWIELDEDYKYVLFDVEHYGMQQRWVVYYSRQSNIRTKKNLCKKATEA